MKSGERDAENVERAVDRTARSHGEQAQRRETAGAPAGVGRRSRDRDGRGGDEGHTPPYADLFGEQLSSRPAGAGTPSSAEGRKMCLQTVRKLPLAAAVRIA